MSASPTQLLERVLAGENLDEPTAAALVTTIGTGELPPALGGRAARGAACEGRDGRGDPRLRARHARARADSRTSRRARTSTSSAPAATAPHSLNLSTGSALLAAACGVPVVKHGNRSVSSRCGSADVLGALGLPIPLDERAAGECLARVGFTFLFAPHYHPAMKHIAPVRQALGVRTVFNISGPLVNPAAPPYHVIGAFSDRRRGADGRDARRHEHRPRARDSRPLGLGRGDARGPVRLLRRAAGSIERELRDSRDYGLPECSLEDLRGGDAATNAAASARGARGRRHGRASRTR